MPQPLDVSQLTSAEKDALSYGLLERVEELERRLGLNSTNSGNPPSSDGLKKARRVQSLRTPSGKKSGGQAGHEGTTLRPVETPDEVQEHYPSQCTHCGEGLEREARTAYQKRQGFELPAPQPLHGTEHRAHQSGCGQCGGTTQAAFPAEVTAAVQDGRSLTALVGYWQWWQWIPEDRLAELLRDVFGVDLATAINALPTSKKDWKFSDEPGRRSAFLSMGSSIICTMLASCRARCRNHIPHCGLARVAKTTATSLNMSGHSFALTRSRRRGKDSKPNCWKP